MAPANQLASALSSHFSHYRDALLAIAFDKPISLEHAQRCECAFLWQSASSAGAYQAISTGGDARHRFPLPRRMLRGRISPSKMAQTAPSSIVDRACRCESRASALTPILKLRNGRHSSRSRSHHLTYHWRGTVSHHWCSARFPLGLRETTKKA
jgi:hypothetical protein